MEKQKSFGFRLNMISSHLRVCVQLWTVGWNKQTCWRRHFGLIVTTFLTIFRVWTKQTINGSTEKRIQMSSSSTNSRKILLWHERTRTEEQTQRTPDSPEYFTLITFDRLHSHTVTESFHCNRVLFYCGISTSTAVNNVNILQALTGSSSQTCWMCFHPRCEMFLFSRSSTSSNSWTRNIWCKHVFSYCTMKMEKKST